MELNMQKIARTWLMQWEWTSGPLLATRTFEPSFAYPGMEPSDQRYDFS